MRSGAPQTAGSTVLDLKAKGAPVEYKLANKGNNWNAAYIGMILKQAPHPSGRQLLANFIISPEGQALHNFGLGATVPGHHRNLLFTAAGPRANDLSPAKVKAFLDRWPALFHQ